MIRQGADIKNKIEEVFTLFEQLRLDDEKLTDTLYGRHGDRLDAALEKAEFRRRIIVASADMEKYSHDAEQASRVSLVFSIASRERERQSLADDAEVGAAWFWNEVDKGGQQSQTIRRALVARSFAAVWVYLNPFKLPSEPSEREAYLKSYFPIRIEVDAARASAFLENQGRVTLAVRKVEKTIVEIVHDYNKRPDKKDRNPLQIWNEDFPHLRAGHATDSWSEKDQLGKLLTLWQLDDGDHICHYAEGLPGQDYQSISNQKDDEPWENPIGRPLCVVGSGFWNPDAERIADRYRAMLYPALEKAYQRDLGYSMLASYWASMSMRLIELPPEALHEVADIPTLKERAEFLDNVMVRETAGIVKVMGVAKSLDTPMPEILGRHLQKLDAEFQALLPARAPDEATLRASSATAIAIREAYKDLSYGPVREALARIVHDVTEIGFDLYRESDRSRFLNKPGTQTSIDLMGLTSGSESVKGKRIETGRRFSLGPKVLGPDDSWYDLHIDPVDNSAGAKAARRAAAAELKAMGAIDDEQWLEMLDFTNVGEQLGRLQVQEWDNMSRKPIAALALASALRRTALETGVPEQQLIALASGGAPGQPFESIRAAGDGFMPRQPYQVTTPQPQEPEMEVTS